MIRILFAALLVLLAAPIALAGSPPKPVKSEFLVTEGGGFIMKRGEGVMYAMTFSTRKSVESPLYAVISFENPTNKKAPFIVESTLQPDQKELLVDSPPILRIKNGATYEVKILIYSDESHTKQIGKHKQKILFSMPADAARSFGIELI